ncbi:unnamed protein product [Auanema sp. JU1783]|nr:unnamed protein product [Auanema sp. JU1783]
MSGTMPALDDDAENKDEERTLKIVVCGDGSSGKTSLCQRFSKNGFDRAYHQTIGLDFYSRRLTLPGDIMVLLQVWDIGGQSIAGELIDKYIYGAHCALLVYDVTNTKSYDNIQDWISVIRRVTKQQEKPPEMILVGNKVDLEAKRAVTIDMHNQLVKKFDLDSAYTSAKTGDSVLLTFRQAAARVLKIVLSKSDQESDIVIVQGEVAAESGMPRKSRMTATQSSGICSVQ